MTTKTRIRIKFAAECATCGACGEPWCEECGMHYVDCSCIGPSEAEDLGYTLIEKDGILYAEK